jgi:deoxyribose-phosphate aldolase
VTRDARALLAFVDLAALGESETAESVRAACAQGVSARVAAVCVHPEWVAQARKALARSPVRLASVAGGFPRGRIPLPDKLAEIRRALADGADEIDAVIASGPARRGDGRALFDEVAAFRDACGTATLKVILRTGVLGSSRVVASAARTAIRAGADFIKTSTGRERVNATLPAGRVMAEAIREHAQRTGRRVGLKPAGGIRTPGQALEWAALVHRELGEAWMTPSLFRIGTSALVTSLASSDAY